MPTQHALGCYWVQPATGTIQRQCNPLLAGALGQVGFVGQSGQQPGFGGHAFPTFQDAKTYLADNPSWQHKAASAVKQSAAADLGGINAIGDFFNRLTQANTWIRVGEVLAGLVLVWVGFNAITRDTAVGRGLQSAKSGAKKTAETIGMLAPK